MSLSLKLLIMVVHTSNQLKLLILSATIFPLFPQETNQHQILIFVSHQKTSTFFLSPQMKSVPRFVPLIKATCAGLDNICAKHLKLVAQYICFLLSNIINKIFTHGIFPSFLKRAKIIPVLKKETST